MNHKDLVKRAETWLRNTKRCRVVATEFVAGDGQEIPDAIGWTGRGGSILVECKTSISDFKHDKTKISRNAEAAMGVGRRRLYLVTPEVAEKIKDEDLLEGWGLAVAHEKQVRYKKKETTFLLSPESHRREKVMLLSMAWRALEAVSLVKPFTITEHEVFEKPKPPLKISPIEVIAQIAINSKDTKGYTAPRILVEKKLAKMYPRASEEDVKRAVSAAIIYHDVYQEEGLLFVK